MRQLSILLAICVLTACSKQPAPDVVHSSFISVVYDLSDSMSSIPDADPILALYDFEHYEEQAASLRLAFITDKLLNPVKEIHIDDGTTTEISNINEVVDYREQLVHSYYDEARKAISNAHSQHCTNKSLDHSECYVTIVKELEELVRSQADRQILIVYSDLQENADVFSCYRPRDQRMLQDHLEEVARLMSAQRPLPDNLKGITVYFVFNPNDRDQDKRFDKMAELYKQMLGGRGARIIIQATNKSYTL